MNEVAARIIIEDATLSELSWMLVLIRERIDTIVRTGDVVPTETAVAC